jgi:hypothetical protein
MHWLSLFLYGSEIRNRRKQDEKLLASIEMKFFRSTAGYNFFYHKRKDEILEEL